MNTHSMAESAKSLANGASRELMAVNRRVADGSKELANAVSEHSAILLSTAAAGLKTAGRSAQKHPWIASAALVAGLAALGGILFSRRVRSQQQAPANANTRRRRPTRSA